MNMQVGCEWDASSSVLLSKPVRQEVVFAYTAVRDGLRMFAGPWGLSPDIADADIRYNADIVPVGQASSEAQMTRLTMSVFPFKDFWAADIVGGMQIPIVIVTNSESLKHSQPPEPKILTRGSSSLSPHRISNILWHAIVLPDEDLSGQNEQLRQQTHPVLARCTRPVAHNRATQYEVAKLCVGFVPV